MVVWKKKKSFASVSMISRGILIFILFELNDSYKKNSY